MNLCYLTDIGKKRKSNQDSVSGGVILDNNTNNISWSVVCDGMGGNNGGDIASSMAVENIKNIINLNLENIKKYSNSQDFESFMKYCIEDTNLNIYKKSQEIEDLNGMGTTIVFVFCVLKSDNLRELYIMHVGDSRCYVLSSENKNIGDIRQITVDHSIVQEMLDRGEITEQEAQNHARKNIITRALGVNSEVNYDYNKISLNSQEIVMLCTDGLTNLLNNSEIYNLYIKNINNLDKLPEILINRANNLGGHDNITVSLIY